MCNDSNISQNAQINSNNQENKFPVHQTTGGPIAMGLSDREFLFKEGNMSCCSEDDFRKCCDIELDEGVSDSWILFGLFSFAVLGWAAIIFSIYTLVRLING